MTSASTSDAKARSGEPWKQILARVAAAIFSGYALIYTSRCLYAIFKRDFTSKLAEIGPFAIELGNLA
jgi:hypothetical protein